MSEPEFILKTTPPRMPRGAIERERLMRVLDDALDGAATALVAPAGFGKTTLLLQWRKRCLERNVRVAWLGSGKEDDPVRFTMALLHAVRNAGVIRDTGTAERAGLEALTWMLAEIARSGVRTVIMIDDAERLPESTVQQAVEYLLFNAPANVHIAIGSRVPLALHTAELVAKGNFTRLGPQELRLELEESAGILDKRLGARLTPDQRADVHDATEGWPIGLQLAIAAIEQAAVPAAAVQALSARRGHLQEYFVDTLIARLPGDAMEVLTRIAILDGFNDALCELVAGKPVADLLQRLVLETPIMMVGEHEDWLRLHPLARDFLLARFEQLPDAERAGLHARASHWYMRNGRLHEAALHALAAGDEELAHDYAARALWALGAGGKVEEAREWLARAPGALRSRDPQLRLGAAAVLAWSDRHADGRKIANEVLGDPATTPEVRVVAMRVATTAAAFADDIGFLASRAAAWPAVPASVDPLYTANRLNVAAFVAVHRGDTEHARALMAQSALLGREGSLHLASALGRMLVALSHLWDGNPRLAEAEMRAALAVSEREDGRRSMIAGLHSSMLAEALLQLDQPDAAQALLANRVDVIERCGFPDNIIAAYRPLIHAAAAQGDERRAFSVLDSLDAIAHRRRLPRLRLHSLAERIRLLALRGCIETAAESVKELDALRTRFQREDLAPYVPQYAMVAAIAQGYLALAREANDEADRHLALAAARAAELGRGGDACAIKLLRGVAAHQRGDAQAQAMLGEAMQLASLSGLQGLLANTHPLVAEMAVARAKGAPRRAAQTADAAPRHNGHPAQVSLLTAKESEVLAFLERGLSNKRIAQSLDIGIETVKWHVKNLLSKLSARSREHAVDRARLLGLVK